MPSKAATLCLFLLAAAFVPVAAAQLAVVEGQVKDAEDRGAIEGASVLLSGEGTRRGTTSDADGRFIFTGITPGQYQLTISHVGFSARTDTFTLSFGERVVVAASLEPDQARMEEVVVESQREQTRRTAGFEKVLPSALERVPMPGLSADLLGYILTLPGIVTMGDRGGQLFIRGGTPTQNLILLDGMRIYQPFHIVGFYSIFPADLLAYADIFAGGFGARYGGRIASVIDVATRNGNKQRVAGSASVAPFLSSFHFEGPLVPGKMSVILSARESVIERISPHLLGRVLPYRFGDVFLKTHAYLSKTSSFAATALMAHDRGDIAGDADQPRHSTWKNQAAGGRYTYLPPDAPVMAQFGVFVSRFDNEFAPAAGPVRTSSAESVDGEINFTYLLGSVQLHLGIFGGSHTFRYNLADSPQDTYANVSAGGAFVDSQFQLGSQLFIAPGLRLQSHSNDISSSVEPRLRLRWRVRANPAAPEVSAAWGIYHQQIVGLTNPRDVTDAFVAWAPSPPNRSVPRAMHVIAGVHQQLAVGLDLSIEAYHKTLDHLTFPLSEERINVPGRIDEVEGRARGLDLRAEFTRPRFYGYAGYGLALVQYQRLMPGSGGAVVIGEPFPAPHDRRHQVNLMAQFARGAYRLSLRWHYGSGLPFTRIQGYLNTVPLGGPDSRTFHTALGETRIVYGDSYGGRLPSYHRLDVSLDRRFDYRHWSLALQAGVTNAYDRANIFNYDLLTNRRVNQLPLIPSVGLRVEVR